MTLTRSIIERFATKEAERGHTAEYVGSCINCTTLEELVDEVSMWVNETQGDKPSSAVYILSVLDTVND